MGWVKRTASALALVIGLLVGFEGFRSRPYQDQAGVWTNGYGNTDGVSKNTPAVSEPEARAALERHVDKWLAAVDKALTRPASEGQTAAYVSLTHNIGASAFRGSSVARRHNAGDFVGACNAILMWDKITVNGVLVKNQGLVNRRASERAVCLKGLS